jgi:Holliday junction resolvase-like predicted endonuclease
MNYKKFSAILNKHILLNEKKEVLKSLANNPERFIGLFRPTKPRAKLLQYLLQSHEIRMGDALEEILEEIFKKLGYKTLNKNFSSNTGDNLLLDQFFTDGKKYFFIEQKIRDDHDSSKKRGQISNFETKLDSLYKNFSSNLVGIMFFIDPELSKNKNFYLNELKRLEDLYGVELHIFYGKQLFDYFKQPKLWDRLLSWLEKWKESLPELPEINFDSSPKKSFQEVKDLELRYWKKILSNEKLWEQGLMKVLFKDGTTLKLLKDYFSSKSSQSFKQLEKLLNEKIKKYFEENYSE